MLEVTERMNQIMHHIMQNNLGHKVAVISHGAAIKFYLSAFCNLREDKLFYHNSEIKLYSPSIVKLIMNDGTLKNMKLINSYGYK